MDKVRLIFSILNYSASALFLFAALMTVGQPNFEYFWVIIYSILIVINLALGSFNMFVAISEEIESLD